MINFLSRWATTKPRVSFSPVVLSTGLTNLDLFGPKFEGERLQLLVSSACRCKGASVGDNRKWLKCRWWANVKVDSSSNSKLSM